MPVDTDELLEQQSGEQEGSTQEEFLEAMPGEFCPIDATEGRIDLSTLTDEQKGILKELGSCASQRDLTSYRLEVRDVWKQRYFDRGNQYLLPGKNGAWILPKMVLMAGQSYDDNNQETNIYLAFRDTICAALTAQLPQVFFEAEDPSNPDDITAAEKSVNTVKLLERNNNMVELQADLVRFLCTDGRAVMHTHHVVDAQRFGWRKSDLDEQLNLMSEADLVVGGPGNEEPRSQQIFDVDGVLEWKFPIQAKDIDQCDYAQKTKEYDVSFLRTKYPDFADKIVPATTPTAQSDYVRLARVSINMGMRPSNMTTDAQTYNATEQITWCRPSFFNQESAKFSDELRNWLLDTFPKGLMVTCVGNELVEAREEAMSEHLTLFHSRPGDGMHRPSLCGPLVPIQEKLNDCMDLVHQSCMHLIPRIWVGSDIDLAGVEKTKREPGQYMKAPKMKEGKSVGDLFFAEPQIQLAEGLLVYIEKLFGEFAQFLCGAFPALFGGDTKANDTASGIQMQRDQALGRIGLTWRNVKSGYARAMKNAVVGVARYQQGTFSGQIKIGQDKQYIAVDPEDLRGNVKCFAETDESFPESWVIQRAVWNSLLAAAQKNPVIARIITLPKNLMVMKDKIGTPEITVPEAASEKKQLREIKELLASKPQPNPILQQAQQQIQRLVDEQVDPRLIQVAQQKLQQANIPPFVSSVKISMLDNDDFEMAAITTFSSEDEGITARATNPLGWMNLELHYQEHAQASAQKKAAAAAGKPPSESINYKDLETPEAKAQMLKQAGIMVDVGELKLELAKQDAAEQKDREQKAAAAAAGGGSGHSSGSASGQS